MTTDIKTSVAKLNAENYFTWKFKLEMLLIKEGVWEVLTTAKPATGDDAWIKKDNIARATISLTVEDDQLHLIRQCKTAAEMWQNLQNYHERKSLSNKVGIMRRICSMRLEDGGDVKVHIGMMSDLFLKLQNLGENTFSEKWNIAMLLSSLPANYNSLITALESRSEEELTIGYVESKLIEEYSRRKGGDSNDSQRAMVASNRKQSSNVECYFCHKKGHLKKNCIKYKDWKRKQPQQKANTANADNNFCLVTTDGSGKWIIDSGASCHICNDKDLFINMDSHLRKEIILANGEKVISSGEGTIKIKLKGNNNDYNNITIYNVLYAPTVNMNILSVKQLTRKGCNVDFQEEKCIVRKDGKVVIYATSDSGLYLCQIENQLDLANVCSRNCIHYWHKVLGHRDTKAIETMNLKNLADGLEISKCGVNDSCQICPVGKSTRTRFPKKEGVSSVNRFDLIHTDLCGPMEIATPSGNLYILTFIDDYSRYCHINLLKHKSEVPEKLKNFVSLIRTNFGVKPKMFRSDRGKEYINKEIINFLENEGIQIQYTAGYSPEQNGVAERKNRSLIEMVRCMLAEAKLPGDLWGEAVSTSNYLQNRILTRTTGVTPYERMFNKVPDLSNLRIFGETGFVHIPKIKRKKLSEKSIKMIFVGYDSQSKAYRMVDEDRRIHISRDVKFTGKLEGFNKKDGTSSNEFEIFFKGDDLVEEDNSCQGSDDSFESFNGFDSDKNHTENVQGIRKSERKTKGQLPARYLSAVQDHVPTTYAEAMQSAEKDNWLEAMEKEFESLKSNQTWVLVKRPSDRNVISCKWVFKKKSADDGEQYKARLVARGFAQQYGVDFDEVFAPVVSHTTLRTLFAISGKRDLKIHHIDCKTAFLNGNLSEEIFMEQPTGFKEKVHEDMVCLLKKSVYGLKQSARAWNQTLHEVLLKNKFYQSNVDPCLYVRSEGVNLTFVLIYVDDILIASKDETRIKAIKKIFENAFKIHDLGPIKYYLGLQVERSERGYYSISQTQYIEKMLAEAGLENSKPSSIPLEVSYGKSGIQQTELNNNRNYQKLIGSLLYISLNSRPDITAAVNILSQKISKPNEEDWTELKRVARYLKGTINLKLHIAPDNDEILSGYSDANWGENRLDRKSNSGYLFKFYGAIISWACRKQTCVTLSSTEAEFVALAEAAKEALWLKQLLADFGELVNNPIVIKEDNQSCIKIVDGFRLNNRTKHIDIKYHFVKDYVKRGTIRCEYCPTNEMEADLLTKPLPSHKIKDIRSRIGLVENLEREGVLDILSH